MSDIKDVERLHSRQIETAKRRQARELNRIETAHQNYKAELKKAHEGEIVDLKEENLRKVAQEAEKKEKVLAEMRDHLTHTQQLTDKELKQLKNSSRDQKQKLQEDLSHNRETVIAEHQLYLDELNERYEGKSRELHHDGENRIERMKQDLSNRYADNEAQFGSKLNKQTSEFHTRFKQNALLQEKLKNEQDLNFKHERMSTNQRQQVEMAKLTEGHNSHIEQRDTEFRKGLKEQDQFFEKKFEVNLNSHNQELSRLDQRHQNVMSKMKKELSAEIVQAAKRSDDPFYQFTELRPQLDQYQDRVEVRVNIPEHAKQDLQLTTNGKEIVVNFNRRYADSNKTADGVIHKVNKVESLSTRLQAEAILDPKSVKASFDDGVMTYVIKKA